MHIQPDSSHSPEHIIPARAQFDAEVEDNLRCPITLGMMHDPVVADDGFTYEREAISNYFNTTTRRVSPFTNAPISTRLTQNWAVRKMIQAHPAYSPPAPKPEPPVPQAPVPPGRRARARQARRARHAQARAEAQRALPRPEVPPMDPFPAPQQVPAPMGAVRWARDFPGLVDVELVPARPRFELPTLKSIVATTAGSAIIAASSYGVYYAAQWAIRNNDQWENKSRPWPHTCPELYTAENADYHWYQVGEQLWNDCQSALEGACGKIEALPLSSGCARPNDWRVRNYCSGVIGRALSSLADAQTRASVLQQACETTRQRILSLETAAIVPPVEARVGVGVACITSVVPAMFGVLMILIGTGYFE